nr:hypothetical protein [Tanacetum cinerariifolium]
MMMRRRSTQLRPTIFHLHLHSVSRLGYLLDPNRRYCSSLRRMLRASSSILPIPLPAASPPLQLLSSDRREDRTKVTLPPRKRLSIVNCPGYEAGESSVAAVARPIEGVNTRVTELAAMQKKDTQDIYGVIEDTQGRQTEIFQRVEALGHLATALGEILALQAREQARKMAPKKAAPKRTTRLNPGATPNLNPTPSTTTTTVTNARLQAMINQGVNAALAACDANQTGDDSHTSGMDVRRTERELALLCVRTCPEESNRVERYIGGLPDTIHKSVVASKPKTMQEATEMATGLMDKKIRIYAERQAANKRKFEDTSQNNQARQQPPKRQDVARAYAAGSSNRQQYAGSRPLCPKCNFNHDGPCTPRCYKCNKSGHLSRDCRSLTNANVSNNQRGNGAGQKVTCYGCGAQGHFKRYCPKLKNNNNNRGNQVGTGNAQARVYAVGNAGTNPDANIVTGTFLLNNCYASVLFDIRADRSFVSTALSSQSDIAPTVLDHDYAVELA